MLRVECADLVITRDQRWRADGVRAVSSLDEAFEAAARLDPEMIFVAGGGEIYRAAWDRLTALEITEVHQEPAGDVTFPMITADAWVEIAREDHEGYSFVGYRRASV